MPPAMIAALPDRGVVSVFGAEAAKLLQGLITNDMDLVGAGGAIHAGLLSPQGKLLFDFFVVGVDGGYVLDVARDKAGDLANRLTTYRLRADAAIANVSDRFRTFAMWGSDSRSHAATSRTIVFKDPRIAELGWRFLVDVAGAVHIEEVMSADVAPASAYHARRIALGVPEGGKDYVFGGAFPHEANLDLFNGLSFTKGCYVGQEVVARMQNKSVVRKRVVRVAGQAPLTTGSDVMLGEAPIGRVGSTDDGAGLAMLRLDRAIEAQDKATPLRAGGVTITADVTALDRYRASAAARAVTLGSPS